MLPDPEGRRGLHSVPWEDNLTYWEVLAELLNEEPPFAEF
jgi:hypothetical protein